MQRHAAALGRRCLCGCDDGTQLGAGDYHNARHGHYQCRAARHRLQFWRRRIQTRAFRHSIHECGLRWVHSRRMAVPVFVPAGVYPPVYFRPRLAGRRRSLHARLFFRIFYDGTAVCRTVHQHGAWTCQTGCFFSLLRKAVIVIPLTLWLPGRFGLGVNGVFLAEPISNFLGGGACFVTMLLTVWPDLKRRERLHASGARG